MLILWDQQRQHLASPVQVNSMLQVRGNQKILALSFLFLAGLFGFFLVTSFFSISKNIKEVSLIGYYLSNFTWLYVLVNFVLSFFVGIVLLIAKQNMHEWMIKVILVIGGVLILFDLSPIAEELWQSVTKGTMNIPWTIIIFGIHVYLFISLVLFKRDNKGVNFP